MLSENLVEFVDIMPTLVEAAGLSQLDLCPEYSRDIPICREGMSLLKIPEGIKNTFFRILIHIFQENHGKMQSFGNNQEVTG